MLMLLTHQVKEAKHTVGSSTPFPATVYSMRLSFYFSYCARLVSFLNELVSAVVEKI
jgi:hypothetical protein